VTPAETTQAAPAKTPAPVPAADAPDLATPAAVWAELLRRVEQIGSFAWVDQVTLGNIDRDHGLVTIRPKPGQRDIARFVGPRQRDRLAGELTKLLGRPIRVELDAPTAPSQDATPTEGERKPGSSMTDRQRAIGLPLVKDVLDAFPDAVLLDARREASESDEPPDADAE